MYISSLGGGRFHRTIEAQFAPSGPSRHSLPNFTNCPTSFLADGPKASDHPVVRLGEPLQRGERIFVRHLGERERIPESDLFGGILEIAEQDLVRFWQVVVRQRLGCLPPDCGIFLFVSDNPLQSLDGSLAVRKIERVRRRSSVERPPTV